jgi:hypothetical protein
VLDHTCHDTSCEKGASCPHRACVNPAHLEPVTHAVNIRRGNGLAAKAARKTHCKRGHPLSGQNLLVDSRGARQCRSCQRLRDRRRSSAWDERQRAAKREHNRSYHHRNRERITARKRANYANSKSD